MKYLLREYLTSKGLYPSGYTMACFNFANRTWFFLDADNHACALDVPTQDEMHRVRESAYINGRNFDKALRDLLNKKLKYPSKGFVMKTIRENIGVSSRNWNPPASDHAPKRTASPAFKAMDHLKKMIVILGENDIDLPSPQGNALKETIALLWVIYGMVDSTFEPTLGIGLSTFL